MDVCQELFHRWPVTVDFFATLSIIGSSLFLPDGESPGSRDRHHVPVLRSPSGFCLPVVRVHPEGPQQGSPVAQPRIKSGGSILATPALVPGPIGTLGRSAGPSSSAQESARSAALPPSSSEPSRAQPDWALHCQLSARHFGFSAEMARQLALCRRSLTCLNYQSKWNTYRAWCHSHGHSISQPSVPKVADFLLYLRRSLHLSYSSIASYRSMLSTAFHFVLPKLFFMISCTPSVSTVLFLLRICLRGIFSRFSLFFGALLSNLSRLVIYTILLVRSSSFSLWLPPAMSASFKLFCLLFLLLATIFFYPIFWSFILSLNPLLILSLVHFTSAPCGIFWAHCLKNYFLVQFVSCIFTLLPFFPISSSAVSFHFSSLSFLSSVQECLELLSSKCHPSLLSFTCLCFFFFLLYPYQSWYGDFHCLFSKCSCFLCS